MLQRFCERHKGTLWFIDMERLPLLTPAFCLAIVLLLGKPALLSDSAERASVAGESLLYVSLRRSNKFFCPSLSTDLLFLRGRGYHKCLSLVEKRSFFWGGWG